MLKHNTHTFFVEKVLFLVPFLLVLSGCDTFFGEHVWLNAPVEADNSHDGLIVIKASKVKNSSGGTLSYLGTYATTAKASEFPQLRAALNYDFSMGMHEVTCAEFKDIMGTAFDERCNDDGSDLLPVTKVTYYDAVLYANERSKREGYDTAYSYTSTTFDASGNCISMEGLVFQPEAEAYRLPTEAEWLMAADRDWNPSYEWNALNSGFEPKNVCSYPRMHGDFCDMAGNVKEWVSDWFGYFKDTTVTNFVGAPDGGVLGERIIKGGSYRNDPSSIKLYNRGDVYIVTSASKSEYLGFRIAFGKIPDAIWMGHDGKARGSRIIPMASATAVKNNLETYRTKLVFRNDVSGNLAYVDYVNGTLTVTEIVDSLDSYHPDISPDGRFVAFCTGMEGVSGKSEAYIRPLSITKSKPLKIKAKGNVSIPRWHVLENGDTVIVYVSDAGNNKDEAVFKSKSTWQVKYANGRFGTPQKLFDGAYHGGISSDNKLAVTGARLLRARIATSGGTLANGRDTVWYNGEQACNVSLANDGSKRVAFLDFGGKTGIEFVGESYGTHERLLIADSMGRLVKAIASPEGYSFDHAEWALNYASADSDGGFIVATLTNANGAHAKIVLVNVKDGSILDLVEGDELWHPSIWRKKIDIPEKNKLDIDSAGVYLRPYDKWESVIMRYKMELLWKYRDSANVAILGSSRPMFGVSPSQFDKKFFAVNFGQTPNSIYMSRDFLNYYIFKHMKKLKYIVVSLDIDFWNKVDGPDGDNFFLTDAENYPGYIYDRNHDYWEKGYPEGLLELTENAVGSSEENHYMKDKGRYLNAVCHSWRDEPQIEQDSTCFDEHRDLIDDSKNALLTIVKEAAKRDIRVVGLIFPQSPAYAKTGAFGRYGMRRSTAQKLIRELEALNKEYPNFVVMDENKMGDHDYTDLMAVDEDHLCNGGSMILTSRLNDFLLSWEAKK
ncbi:TIGR02171 family lipoprotein [Fibrobacter sp. UBA4297]|uniref:TIGR02171 family lipoprotein n=1 Tax=Fibrobacter sp. UBA4297 TaxID=1946536 RepID=UPI0039C8AD80